MNINKKIKVNPVEDWIVIKPIQAKTKTDSGIYIPDKAQSKLPIAKVIRVGKKVKLVKKGDKIYYKKWEGMDYKEDGEAYIFIKPEHCLAIIEE